MTVRPEDKEFIANFYKFAFVGLTLDWIKNDMRQDPAQLVAVGFASRFGGEV